MISPEEKELSRFLGQSIGRDKVGLGLEIQSVLSFFMTNEDSDPELLVKYINELEDLGFIKVEKGIPSGSVGHNIKSLKNIVSLVVLEPLQDYLDNINY